MSKKRTQKRCIVIDASVAATAGSWQSNHPSATLCRAFLESVRNICHRMAWSQAIKSEWDIHQSSFAQAWRVSMTNLKKLVPVTNEDLEDFRNAIKGYSDNPHLVEKMIKDAHLIEAALATDARCASLDEKARVHFSGLAKTMDSLGKIIWVNPANEEENAIEWLEKGAPVRRSNRLKHDSE